MFASGGCEVIELAPCSLKVQMDTAAQRKPPAPSSHSAEEKRLTARLQKTEHEARHYGADSDLHKAARAKRKPVTGGDVRKGLSRERQAIRAFQREP